MSEKDEAARERGGYMRNLAMSLRIDADWYDAPAKHGNDALRHAALIQLRIDEILRERDEARALLREARNVEATLTNPMGSPLLYTVPPEPKTVDENSRWAWRDGCTAQQRVNFDTVKALFAALAPRGPA